MTDLDVAVIGAGPYGLSAGAHLKSAGLGVCVFGDAMDFWAHKMPEGMLLRSPRVASNISDAEGKLTLDAFESANQIKPSAPVPLDTFVAYGRWFGEHLSGARDTRTIAKLERGEIGFRLQLHDGSAVTARKVVLAVGISDFRKSPPVFSGLDPRYVSHCYERRDVRGLSGKRVAVIGAGQSALESAALLHEAGAQVELIVRQPALRWIGMHPRLHHLGPISSLMYSKHDIGPLGISRLVAYPKVMALVPLTLRDKIRTRAVRSAGSNWLPARLTNVKVSLSREVREVSRAGDELTLRLNDGTVRHVDHVLLGTGYRVDISKYAFVDPEIIADIKQFDGYPRLGAGFASSVPNLHFVGAPAARSFGPLLYFVTGTEFGSRELSSHVARKRENTRAVSYTTLKAGA